MKGKLTCKTHHVGRPLKHGKYSKVLVKELAEKIEEVKQDKRYLQWENILATTYSIIEHLGERISEETLTQEMGDVLINRLNMYVKQLETFNKVQHGERHIVTYETIDIVLKQYVHIIQEIVPDAKLRDKLIERIAQLRIPEDS
jgi:hypothetical protein